jgi:hypothetical protein
MMKLFAQVYLTWALFSLPLGILMVTVFSRVGRDRLQFYGMVLISQSIALLILFGLYAAMARIWQ